MTTVLFEILLIVLLAVANGALAMSEIAIVSVRKARLQELSEDGDPRAQIALELANEPTRFLSTVQIGITLVGILAGAVGGATIAKELGALLSRIPLIATYGDVIALAIVVLAIAYLSLVIGELVPKRLALTNPDRVATLVASPMRRLSSLASPIVWLLSVSTEAVLRLLRVRSSSEPSVSEDEVKIMLAEATQEGVFEPSEEDMVKRVFRLGDRRVSALMTHRTDIVWLDITDPPQEWIRIVTGSGHSRFPVARETLDNILGVVQAKDLLASEPVDGPADLKSLLSPPVFVPESTPALEGLERFKESRQSLALVIDEYGGLEGLITLYDVLEALVGDLPEAGEAYVPEAVERRDGSWLLDGMLPIDEFKEILGLDDLPGEARAHFDTVGGFVTALLGRIPSTADHFQWDEWCFEVMDMDGLRVDKILVSPLRREPCQQPETTEGKT